jgi:single-strand DNA-binding protein
MNISVLCGNLGADPILRKTNSGISVANLSVATNERVKQDGEWQDHTEWHNVTVFGKSAEACASNLSKGSKVTVQGKIRTRTFTDKEGRERRATEIVADNVVFAGRAPARQQQADGHYAPPPAPSNGTGFRDDDIPF